MNQAENAIAHLAGPSNHPEYAAARHLEQGGKAWPACSRMGWRAAAAIRCVRTLAAPAKVCRAVFSAPVESDVAELYGPPDGYIGVDGTFRKERQSAGISRSEVELKPEDGLFRFHMATAGRRIGVGGEDALAGRAEWTARLFPDGSAQLQEIDRMSIGVDGALAVCCPPLRQSISTAACRPGASPKVAAGPCAHRQRRGDIPPESHIISVISLITSPSGRRDRHSRRRPTIMQALVASGDYDGVIWTQAARRWKRLLVQPSDRYDIADLRQRGAAPARPRSAPMDRRTSWTRYASFGRARLGLMSMGATIAASWSSGAAAVRGPRGRQGRSRPGGYVAAGGHGGIVGNIIHTGRIALTYLPVFKHTYRSDLKITTLPNTVKAAKKGPSGIEMVDVAIKDGNGKLLPGAIPVVTISADGSYSGMDYGHDTAPEIDLIASIEHKLSLGLLTGFVIQGLVPYGRSPSHTRNKLMLKAAFSGTPVTLAGRGAPMGFADPSDFQIAATNLTATRFLLMACLMKFGSLPAAKDPDKPTRAELDAIRKAVAAYQTVFNEH